MELWICGRMVRFETSSWELIGVYDSRDKAREACAQENDFWGGPIALNESVYETKEFAEDGWYIGWEAVV